MGFGFGEEKISMNVNRAGNTGSFSFLLFSSAALAAPVELPRPSPAASVFENIGKAKKG